MLHSKVYITILVVGLFSFTGCIESRYNFDIDTALNDNADTLLAKLPGIGNRSFGDKDNITALAKQVDVYKAVFKEKYIEKDSLLEYSSMNVKTTLPVVDYKDVDGFEQHLYLLHYQFTYNDGFSELIADAVAFLSLRYIPSADSGLFSTGHGPLYWGIISKGNIVFDSVLQIKKIAEQYQLALKSPKNKCVLVKKEEGKWQFFKKVKQYREFTLLFKPDSMLVGQGFNITKIVRMEKNRIGGTKSLIFNIPAIFGDKTALHFDYDKTITLK